MDFSTLSDKDLEAIASGDLSKASDDALEYLAADESRQAIMRKRMQSGLGATPREPVTEYSPAEAGLLGSIVAPQAIAQLPTAVAGAGMLAGAVKNSHPLLKYGAANYAAQEVLGALKNKAKGLLGIGGGRHSR